MRHVRLAAGFALGIVIAVHFPAVAAEPPAVVDEGVAQKAELNMLRATTKSQAEKIEQLKAANAKLAEQVKQLRELCQKAGIAPPAQTPAGPTTAPAIAPKGETYMYLGTPRSKDWFEQMYRKFADKIVLVGGKYLDVGKTFAGDSEYSGEEAFGRAGDTPEGCVVMQVLTKDQLLVRRPKGIASNGKIAIFRPADLLFHVQGVDTKSLVDGQAFFKDKLIYVGPFHYRTTSGAMSAIPSYAVYVKLTKGQFADALAKGFQLMSYRAVTQQKPDGGTETKAIGTPIP